MKKLTSLVLGSGLALGLACGDNVDGTAGAGPDADVIDDPNPLTPTVGTCSVVAGTPPILGLPQEIGAAVIFQRPDGSVLGVEYTDVKGEASRPDCVANTIVTFVLEDGGSSFDVYTYMAVQPGDTVYLGSATEYEPPPYPFADLNITADQDVSFVDDVDEWNADISCANNWASAGGKGGVEGIDLEDIPPFCLGEGGGYQLFARLYDDGQVVGTSFLKNIEVTGGMEDANAPNPVTLPAWTPGPQNNTCIWQGIPVSVDSFWGQCSAVVDGVYFSGGSFGGDTPAPVETTSFSGYPADFAERSSTWVYYEESLPADQYAYGSVMRIQPFDATTVTDVSTALPAVRSVSVLRNDGGATLVWTSDASFIADVGVIEFYVETDEVDVDWTLVTPNVAGGRTALPPLPAPYGDLFTPAEFFAVPEEGYFVDFSWTNYHSLITTPGFHPDYFEPGYGAPAAPGAGEPTMRTTGWEYD